MLRFFARSKSSKPSRPAAPAARRELPRVELAAVAPATEARGTHADAPHRTCALSACVAGSRATILEMRCGDQEACRLRALGVCEGASVNVLDDRHAMLVDVRGTRLALGRALTAGITVQPVSA